VLGKEVGDRVSATGGGRTLEYHIVGRIVLPTLGVPQPLADGAGFTGRGLARLASETAGDGWFLVGHFASGVDPAIGVRELGRMSGIDDNGVAPLPLEVDRLQQVDRLPVLLAALLALLGTVAIGHALVTAVRRRKRDLAILKTLGFSRRQVRSTVAWQATTSATAGLLLGVPLGLVVGRIAWRMVADGLGVVTHATIPVGEVLLLVLAVLVLANLIAALPAARAARTRPALVLRSE
jgi:hypothetical protein